MDAPSQDQISAYGNYLKSQGVSEAQVTGYTNYLKSQYSGSAATDGSAPPQMATSNPIANMGPTQQMKDFATNAVKGIKPNPDAPFAQNLWDAFRRVGLEESSIGLAIRDKMPEESLPQNAGLLMRSAAAAGEFAGDLPAMAAGGIAGFLSPVPGGATVGAFALPPAIRKLYIDHIQRGDVTSAGEFARRTVGAMWAATKGAITGAATMLAPGALSVAGGIAESAGLKGATSVASNVLSRIAAESATAATVSSGLEGRLPKLEDFENAALAIGALHGAAEAIPLAGDAVSHIKEKIQNIYANTGVEPSDIVDEVQRNTDLKQNIIVPDKTVPKEAQKLDLVHDEETGWHLEPPKASGPEIIEPPKENLPAPVESEKDENGESLEDRVKKTIASAKEVTPEKAPILQTLKQGEKAFRYFAEDELSPISMATNEYEADNGKLDPGKNPAIQAQLYRGGIGGKVLATLVDGVYKFDNPNVKAGPSYLDVTKSFDPAQQDNAEGFLKSLATIADKKGRATGISVPDAEAFVRKYKDQFGDLARTSAGYNESLLDMLVDSGRVSKEKANAARNNRFFYSPMYRDLGLDPAFEIKGGEGSKIFAKMEGNENLKTLPALQAMAENGAAIVQAAEKNRVLGSIVDTFGKDERYLKPVPDGTPALKNEFTYYRNGVPERWATTDKFFGKAIQALNYDKTMSEFWASGPGKVMRNFAALKRVSLTANPLFSLKHGYRSEVAADIQSSEYHVPFASVVQTIAEQLNGSDDFWKFMKSGGAMPAFDDLSHILGGGSFGKDWSLSQKLTHLLTNTYDDPAARNGWNVIGSRVRAMEVMTQVLDQAPRLREFKALKGGEGDYNDLSNAAIKARNISVDYMKRGFAVKWLNMGEPFLGVDIAGTFRAAESLKDPNAVAKALTYITLPEVMNFALHHKDERYKEKPDWYHGAYMYVPLSGGQDFSIPRTFTLGLVYGSFAQMLMKRYVDHNPNAFDNLSEQILEKALPIGLPTAVEPMAEQFANKNNFTGSPLVPDYLQKILPQYQYEPYTSEVARQAAKLIGHIPALRDIGPKNAKLSSPMVLDNYFRDWGGTAGQYLIGMLDAGLHSAGIGEVDKPIDELPGIRRFYSRVSPNQQQSVVDFRNNFSELEKTASTIGEFRYRATHDGDPDAMRQVMDLYKNFNEPLFEKLSSIDHGMRQMSKALWAIQNQKMSSTEKQQMTDAIMAKMVEGAEYGNQIYFKMKGQ